MLTSIMLTLPNFNVGHIYFHLTRYWLMEITLNSSIKFLKFPGQPVTFLLNR